MEGNSVDWAVIARNIRNARLLRGFSQEGLARLAGLGASTIYHAERGRPTRQSSLQKIGAVLGESANDFERRDRRMLMPEGGLVLFRRSEAIWTPDGDTRTKVPSDYYEWVQEPRERERLGKLGLVPVFYMTPNFIMPSGPGLTWIELYGHQAGPIHDRLYRFATLACDAGRARVSIGGEAMILEPGDVAGYHAGNLEWMEPAEDSELPVRLSWTGAERIGGISLKASGTQRVRRPAPS